MKGSKKPLTVAEFIGQYPREQQTKLKKLRAAIRKAAPKAEESIGYGIAAYKLNGKPLIYFSGYKAHIGIYPRHHELDAELADYIGGKGTYKFPLDEPLPLGLITKLVKVRGRGV